MTILSTLEDGSLICSGNLDAPVTRTEAEARARHIEVTRAGYLSGAITGTTAAERLIAAGLGRDAARDTIAAWDDILATARHIERQRLESANNFMCSQRRGDYQRWEELWSATSRAAAWAIERAMNEADAAAEAVTEVVTESAPCAAVARPLSTRALAKLQGLSGEIEA